VLVAFWCLMTIKARLARLERRRLRPENPAFHVFWENEVIDHGDGTYTLPDGQRTKPGDRIIRIKWAEPRLWSEREK